MLHIKHKIRILCIFSGVFAATLLSHDLESDYYPAYKLNSKGTLIKLENEFLKEFPDFPNKEYDSVEIAKFFNKRNILYHFSKKDLSGNDNDFEISEENLKHHFCGGDTFIHFLARYNMAILIQAVDKASDDVDDKIGPYSVNLPYNIACDRGRSKPWQTAAASKSWKALETLLNCKNPIGLAKPYDRVAFEEICNLYKDPPNKKKYLLLLCLRPDFQYYVSGLQTNIYTSDCNSLQKLNVLLSNNSLGHLYPLFEMIHLWRFSHPLFDDVIDSNYLALLKRKIRNLKLNFTEIFTSLCKFPVSIKNLDLRSNVCEHIKNFKDINADFVENVKSAIEPNQLSEVTTRLEEFDFEFEINISQEEDDMDIDIHSIQKLKIDDLDDNQALVEEIDELVTKCSWSDREKLLSLQKEFIEFINYSDNITKIIDQIQHLKLEEESHMESLIKLCIEIQKTEIPEYLSDTIKNKLKLFGKDLYKILYEFGNAYLVKELFKSIDIRKTLMEEFNLQHQLICEINTYKSFEDSIRSWKIYYDEHKLKCLVSGNSNEFFDWGTSTPLIAGHGTKAAEKNK